MFVEKNINRLLSSNSYLITHEFDDGAWIVDPGYVLPLCNLLEKHHKFLKGILVTHSHFDHIYGLNELKRKYPSAEVFGSKLSFMGFQSSKINGSYYTDLPFILDSFDINFFSFDEIQIFEGIHLKIISTPGHSNDCVSFHVGDYLFTGDSLIPNSIVHTRSKSSNKNDAIDSVNFILKYFDPLTVICPGHGETMFLKEVSIPAVKN
jgi:glyoxylase-like metal-dependent hydrolase (beta-lactamase superfamily II)